MEVSNDSASLTQQRSPTPQSQSTTKRPKISFKSSYTTHAHPFKCGILLGIFNQLTAVGCCCVCSLWVLSRGSKGTHEKKKKKTTTPVNIHTPPTAGDNQHNDFSIRFHPKHAKKRQSTSFIWTLATNARRVVYIIPTSFSVAGRPWSRQATDTCPRENNSSYRCRVTVRPARFAGTAVRASLSSDRQTRRRSACQPASERNSCAQDPSP